MAPSRRASERASSATSGAALGNSAEVAPLAQDPGSGRGRKWSHSPAIPEVGVTGTDITLARLGAAAAAGDPVFLRGGRWSHSLAASSSW